MTYKMTEQQYTALAGRRSGDYTTMVVIVLANLTTGAECIVDITIKEFGYKHPEDYEFLFRTRADVYDNRGTTLHVGIHNKSFLEDPRIRELLLEYLV